MTTQRRAPYHLLIGGSWKHLESVAPGVTVTPDRPTSIMKSVGNVVWAQVADVVKRAWGFSFEWDDAAATRWLDYAAANPEVEVWLLDTNLAKINMFDPRDTTGASSTLIDVDGLAMPAFQSFVSEGIKPALVRAGEVYHLSYTTTLSEGAAVGKYSIAGVETSFYAPPGVGARRGSVTFVASNDGLVEVQWRSAGVTTAARLTEGSVDDYGFLESRGATPCQVLVGDVTATYKMAWADRQSLADSSYVLTEVG